MCVCVCTDVYNHTDTYICTSIHISQIYMFNLLFLGHARWFVWSNRDTHGFFTCFAFWSTWHTIRSSLIAFAGMIIGRSIVHYDSDCIGGGVDHLLFANVLCTVYTCWHKPHGLKQYFVNIVMMSTKRDTTPWSYSSKLFWGWSSRSSSLWQNSSLNFTCKHIRVLRCNNLVPRVVMLLKSRKLCDDLSS